MDTSVVSDIFFGQWLSGLLKVRGMSQGELARRIEVPRSTVSKWVRGEHVPSRDSCDKIALALGIPFEEVAAAAGHMVPTETFSRGPVKDRLVELIERIPSEQLAAFIPVFEQLAGEGRS
jgi:transcriptional regulator with XRE-family HTH domain